MKISKPSPLFLSERSIQTELPAYVMGIVNATPDSFFSESRMVGNVNKAVESALEMISKGADIIDIGGESTRPGADYVSVDTELKRVIPIVEGIRKYSVCPISIDTRKSKVLKEALRCGANILNDISAMQDDPNSLEMVLDSNIPVILMHKKGTPLNMQKNPVYTDVIKDVTEYLQNRIKYIVEKGVDDNKIIIDAGIGFGKNLADNISLIKASEKIKKGCGKKRHIVMALSRKTCIGEITGKEPERRLYGTIAANLLAVQYGADILRVHDVAAAVDMLKIYKEIG